MGALRVSVDPDRCVASGTCVALAPDIFELPQDASHAVVRVPTVDGEAMMALAREAEESCPSMAIVLDDESG